MLLDVIIGLGIAYVLGYLVLYIFYPTFFLGKKKSEPKKVVDKKGHLDVLWNKAADVKKKKEEILKETKSSQSKIDNINKTLK